MRDFADDSAPRVRRLPDTGMVMIRGRLQDGAFAAGLEACGLTVPGQRRIVSARAGGVVWMSPDELLVLCATDGDADLAERVSAALAGQHHLAMAVGDMRARFEVAGPRADIALAKLCPVDMARFGGGEVRRTRLAQVPTAFWRSGAEGFEVICFRSVADYAHEALVTAARDVAEITLP